MAKRFYKIVCYQLQTEYNVRFIGCVNGFIFLVHNSEFQSLFFRTNRYDWFRIMYAYHYGGGNGMETVHARIDTCCMDTQ